MLIKNKGSFLIEWSVSFFSYSLLVISYILVCFWFYNISTIMFYVNIASRYSFYTIHDPESSYFQSDPFIPFQKKMESLVNDNKLLISNVKYSVEYYGDDINNSTTTFSYNDTKVSRFTAEIIFNNIFYFTIPSGGYKFSSYYLNKNDLSDGVLIP